MQHRVIFCLPNTLQCNEVKLSQIDTLIPCSDTMFFSVRANKRAIDNYPLKIVTASSNTCFIEL